MTVVIQPVEPLDCFGLGSEVDGLHRLGLHAVGQLVILDAGEQIGLAGMSLGVGAVEPRRSGRACGAGGRGSRPAGRFRLRIGEPCERKLVAW